MIWTASDIIYWVAVAFIIYMIVSVIGVILLENRNPLNSLTWILILILLPVIGLILYFFLGQNFRHKKIISKRSIKKIAVQPIDETINADIVFPEETKKIICLFKNNSKTPLYEISKIEIHTTGKETFDALLK
nr:PLDc N-terminal domain-containing protein [Paludibacteraceae bacterium]